jgi:hypothetical protein
VTFKYTDSVSLHVSLKNTNAVLQEQVVWFFFVVEENGHSEHCRAPVLENVLLLHSSQGISPATAFTLPGAHPAHLPSSRVYPALHTHAVAMLISFLPHRTMLPSLSEIGRVVRCRS